MFLEYKNKLQRGARLAGAYLWRFRDVRLAGQVLFAVVVVLVSWSGVKAIDANYVLQKQIAAQQQQNEIQQLENSNLKLQNDYYNSNQYLELSARQNFGLAAAGEKELIVPKAVALAYTVPEPKPLAPPAAVKLPFYERNLQAWVNFFLHRPQPPQV
jgi:cell division protein FtsB